MLRLDKIHPLISGNKWFKLRFYLEDAKSQGYEGIATFGGAWSNHLLAVAAACAECGLKSIGIIRGEEPAVYSATLNDCKASGMELLFLSREEYRHAETGDHIPDSYLVIPEGGRGASGLQGAATIADYIADDFTHVCCAAGTGTMLTGLLQGTTTPRVVAISVLKNNRSLNSELETALPNACHRCSIIHDYHFGGYAKYTDALITFMNDLYLTTGIPTDFVYTAKLFYAVNELALSGYFSPESKVLIIHSGGLQGNRSLSKGSLIF